MSKYLDDPTFVFVFCSEVLIYFTDAVLFYLFTYVFFFFFLRGILWLCSFITEPTSVGLNTCLSISGKCSDPQVSATEALDNGSLCFGIPNTKLCAQINSAFLKGVKYFGGSYTAFLSPV